MYHLITLDIVSLDGSQMSIWAFQKVRKVVRLDQLLVRDSFYSRHGVSGGDSLGWHTLIQLVVSVI
jgi:hypothetical protein